MKKLYDLAVKNGTYTQNGQEKGRYVNIGSMMEGDTGPFILLNAHANLAAFPRRDGADSVMVSMFEPKAKPERHDFSQYEQRPIREPETAPVGMGSATPEPLNDEIPF